MGRAAAGSARPPRSGAGPASRTRRSRRPTAPGPAWLLVDDEVHRGAGGGLRVRGRVLLDDDLFVVIVGRARLRGADLEACLLERLLRLAEPEAEHLRDRLE